MLVQWFLEVIQTTIAIPTWWN